MIRKIYNALCEDLKWIKEQTNSVMNKHKHAVPVVAAGALSVGFILSLSGVNFFGLSSSRRISNGHSLGVETEAFPVNSEVQKLQSEIVKNAALTVNSKAKRLKSKVIKPKTELVLVNETPKKWVTIATNSVSAKMQPIQSDVPSTSLNKRKIATNSVSAKMQPIQSDVPSTSLNERKVDLQFLNFLSRFYNRYLYIGTRPIEIDPSRAELSDPIGCHPPTTLRIGNLQTTFRIPGAPKTLLVKLSSAVLDPICSMIPESCYFKSLATCFTDSITIGPFHTQMVTRRGTDERSVAMYENTRVEQHQHRLMQEQFDVFSDPEIDPRVTSGLNVDAFYRLGGGPGHNFVFPDFLNADEIRNVYSELRVLLFPRYPEAEGPIPQYCNTENRILLDDDQIKSENFGMLYEIDVLPPALLILRQRDFWARYLENRVSIYFRKTKTNIMNTNLVEMRVNLSEIALDGLRVVTAKTPFVKKSHPAINKVALIAQEWLQFFPVEMSLHAGHQHSYSVNFNTEQERLRTVQIHNNNLQMEHDFDLHPMVLTLPLHRRGLVTDMNEIHSCGFYGVKFTVRFKLDLFDLLEKLTAVKDKSRS